MVAEDAITPKKHLRRWSDGAPPPVLAQRSQSWMILQETRELRVRATVSRLLEVKLVEQTFKASVQIEASWVDPDLKVLSKNSAMLDESADARRILVDVDRTNQYTGKMFCYLPPESESDTSNGKDNAQRYWAPRLYFENVLIKENEEQWYRFYDHEPQNASIPPVVCLLWKFTGTFQEIMELWYFPLDYQNLTMRLVSGYQDTRVARDEKRQVVQLGSRKLAKQVDLVKNQSTRYRSNLKTNSFLQANEYKLYPRLNFFSGETKAEDSASGLVYPFLDIQMRVRRKPWNWFFNVVFPLFIIQGSLVTTYAIDSGLSDRLGITITLLLAIVAFRYVVSEKLPNISYATLIDLYVLSSFLLAAMIIADQTCQGVGLYTEAREAVFNVDGWVQSPDGTWSRTEVEVSSHLLLIFQIWLGSHAAILLAVLMRAAYFFRDEEKWSHSELVVWIGSLVEESIIDDVNGLSKVRLTDTASAALHSFFCHVLSIDERKPPRWRLKAWTPAAANASLLKASNEASEEDFNQKRRYNGTSAFAIAIFASEADTKRILSYAASELSEEEGVEVPKAVQHVKAFFKDGQVRVEFLDEKYTNLSFDRAPPPSISKLMPAAAYYEPLNA